MTAFNKLVRDRIPDIIRANGKTPLTSTLSEGRYLEELKKKLKEEVAEFLQDVSIEELADVQEVVYALCAAIGSDEAELERVRKDKAAQRGAFRNRVFLIETSD